MSERKYAHKKSPGSSKLVDGGWGNTMALTGPSPSTSVFSSSASVASGGGGVPPRAPEGALPHTPPLMAGDVALGESAQVEKKVQSVQCKYWTWTSYDHEDSVIDFARTEVEDQGCLQYICWQPELCPSTGTAHLQAVICFKKKITLFGVRKVLLGRELKAGHLEPVRNLQQAIEYCKKEESKAGDFREFGNRPSMRQLAVKDTAQALAIEQLRNGASIQDIMTIWPQVYIRHCRGLQELACHFRKAPPREGKPNVWVLWGPTGTGKSHTAMVKAEEYCTKHNCQYARVGLNGGWWDGYSGEQALIIEEFCPSKVPLDLLLQVTDKYDRVRVPVKGGFIPMNARFIVFTSSQDPSTWYKDKGQLARRVSVVAHLTERFERKQSWQSKVVAATDLGALEV